MTRKKPSTRTILAVACAAFTGACASMQTPSIKGAPSKSTKPQYIPQQLIVKAMQCSLGRGIRYIVGRQELLHDPLENTEDSLNNPTAQRFKIRSAEANLTGEYTIASENGFSFTAAIPIGSADNEDLSPSAGRDSATENVLTMNTKININPDMTQSRDWKGAAYASDPKICSHKALSAVDLVSSDFVTEAIEAAYNDWAETVWHRDASGDLMLYPDPKDSATPPKPKSVRPGVRPQEITLIMRFTVARDLSAGVEAAVIFNPYNIVTDLGPSITNEWTKKGVYTLKIELDLAEKDENRNKRLHVCKANDNGTMMVCVEGPYSLEKLNKKEEEIDAINERISESRKMLRDAAPAELMDLLEQGVPLQPQSVDPESGSAFFRDSQGRLIEIPQGWLRPESLQRILPGEVDEYPKPGSLADDQNDGPGEP